MAVCVEGVETAAHTRKLGERRAGPPRVRADVPGLRADKPDNRLDRCRCVPLAVSPFSLPGRLLTCFCPFPLPAPPPARPCRPAPPSPALVQLFTLSAATTDKDLARFARPLGAVMIVLGLLTLVIGVGRYFLIQDALVRGMYPVARVSTTLLSFTLLALVLVVFVIILVAK